MWEIVLANGNDERRYYYGGEITEYLAKQTAVYEWKEEFGDFHPYHLVSCEKKGFSHE